MMPLSDRFVGRRGADDIDGADDAAALRDGVNDGVRNTQLAMHSANIGIVASNRIVIS